MAHSESVGVVAQKRTVFLEDAGQKVVFVDSGWAVLDGQGQGRGGRGQRWSEKVGRYGGCDSKGLNGVGTGVGVELTVYEHARVGLIFFVLVGDQLPFDSFSTSIRHFLQIHSLP